MEVSLAGLITKIKEEGVAVADKEAQGIVAEAEKKAKSIIVESKKQADAIVLTAKQDAEKLEKQAEEAARQSIRDVILMLKQRIVELLDVVLKRQIKEQLQPDVLKEIIVKLVESFKKDKQLDLEIILGKGDKDKLEKLIFDGLTKEMSKGVTLKVSPNVESGFRIGRKGENSYYDFTDEALTEALKVYLNPKLREILEAKQ